MKYWHVYSPICRLFLSKANYPKTIIWYVKGMGDADTNKADIGLIDSIFSAWRNLSLPTYLLLNVRNVCKLSVLVVLLITTCIWPCYIKVENSFTETNSIDFLSIGSIWKRYWELRLLHTAFWILFPQPMSFLTPLPSRQLHVQS